MKKFIKVSNNHYILDSAIYFSNNWPLAFIGEYMWVSAPYTVWFLE